MNVSGREYAMRYATFVSFYAATQDSSTCTYVYCDSYDLKQKG